MNNDIMHTLYLFIDTISSSTAPPKPCLLKRTANPRSRVRTRTSQITALPLGIKNGARQTDLAGMSISTVLLCFKNAI